MRFKCRDTKELVYTYSDYLMTRHWRTLRERVYMKSGGTCYCCKGSLMNGFVAHHRTTGAYWRVGRERINHRFWRDDVVAVCNNCHDGKSKNHDRLHEFIRVPDWARKEMT